MHICSYRCVNHTINIVDDYISGPYDVIFLSGRTNYVINITIVDDNLLEPVESFNLTIDSLSGDAMIGNLDHTMISIFDNDGMYASACVHHNNVSIFNSYHCTVHTTVIHYCRKNWNSTARTDF